MEFKRYMEKHYGCRVALRSPAHITLVPPFNMDADKEDELGVYLGAFAATQKSFSVQLHNFDCFKPRVIFVQVHADKSLLQIKERLDDYLLSLKNFSFKKEDRPFHPHITIANRDLKESDFPAAWAHFSKLAYETTFTASAISLLRHNNKVWEIAQEWPTPG
jgi:2'-5' RNA ligase